MSTVRIATFNVYYGKQPEKLAEEILKNPNLSRADFILLQEIEAHPGEVRERAKVIAEILKMNCLYAPARQTKNNGTHGLAILSRCQYVNFEVVPLPKYNLRYNSRERIALNAIYEVNGQMIQISNVHLDLRINIKDRILQIAAVLDKLDSHQVKKTVMAGDFNTVPLYWAARVLPIPFIRQRSKFNAFVHSRGFQTRLADIGQTIRGKIMKFSLDSIYTKGLDIEAFGIEKGVSGSDHYPVWADLSL